ncbi:MAG: mechanosensitive ion channel family protein [Candidatus Caldarchaeum sp.]|nr:mechanosensitive ion channel family protein [Candidatus Caldarchaeum sp.]
MPGLKIRFVVTVLLAAGLYLTTYAFVQLGLLPAVAERIILVLGTVLAGAYLVRVTASYVVKTFQPLVGQQAIGGSLIIQLIGYIFIAFFLLSSLGVSPETALAGGTITGLVVGLAGQTTLSNVIAGIILLVSRPFKIGDRVAVVTSSVPYQWAFLPGYKYFSRDYVVPAYTGVVENMSLMYTTIVTDDKLVIRIPNNIILANSAIANYSEVSERVRKLRYEFPIDIDPNLVIERLKTSLSEIDEVKQIYLEEQSDKTHYIVTIVFEAPLQLWHEIKSKILAKVITVHREVKQTVTA